MTITCTANDELINKPSKEELGGSRRWRHSEFSEQEFQDHILRGHPWAPGIVSRNYEGTNPSVKDILYATMIGIDIDGDLTIEEALKKPIVSSMAYMIYTTPSHTNVHNKFRIIYKLPVALQPREFSRILNDLMEHLPADPSCKNVNRIFFGNTKAEIYFIGKTIPERVIENKLNANSKRQYEMHSSYTVEDARDMLSYIPAQTEYNTWLKVISALVNSFGIDVALGLVEAWSPDKDLGTEYKLRHALPEAGLGLLRVIAQDYGYREENVIPRLENIEEYDLIIVPTKQDADVLDAIGFPNVVWIPEYELDKQRLDSISNSMEELKAKTKYTLLFPYSRKGREFREEVARRLGKEKCFVSQFPKRYDTLDELMLVEGEDSVIALVIDATLYPVEGVIMPSERRGFLEDLYDLGFPNGSKQGIEVEDEMMTYFPGQLTVVTGIPSHGKSNKVSQKACRLSVTNQWKVAFFSPEDQIVEYHKYRLAEILVGKPFFQDEHSSRPRMTKDEMQLVEEYINEHFYYIMPEDENYTLDQILAKVEWLVSYKSINMLVLDPWNTIEHMLGKDNEHIYTGKALNKIKAFSRKVGVHTILVAHPRKMMKEEMGSNGVKAYHVPTPYDISGSSNWYNVPDNIIIVYRDTSATSNKSRYGTDYTWEYQAKVKHKFVGKMNSRAKFHFDPDSQRFYPDKEPMAEGIWI